MPVESHAVYILVADIEEELGKVKWERVRGESVYGTLSYADNMVLLAKNEDEMRNVIEKLEVYLERKRLEVTTNKMKIIRFRKGGGRMEKRNWKWKATKIKKVREHKYLRYVIQRNGRQETHIRDRARKAMVVTRQMWGIGKRKFGLWEKGIGV